MPDVPDVPTCLKCSLPCVSACFRDFASSVPSFFLCHTYLQHLRAFFLHMPYVTSFFACLACLHFFYVLSFFKYVHYVRTLSAYVKCSYFTYMYSLFLYSFIFYMCLHFFGALHTFVFDGLHFLRTFTFLCAYILFTSFRFFYMLSYFLHAS